MVEGAPVIVPRYTVHERAFVFSSQPLFTAFQLAFSVKEGKRARERKKSFHEANDVAVII